PAHGDHAAPGFPRARDLVCRRQDLPAAVRVPAGYFALGRGARTRAGTGSVADRQEGYRDTADRAGGQLRNPALLLRRARHRHLFLDAALRLWREPGRDVEALSRAHGGGGSKQGTCKVIRMAEKTTDFGYQKVAEEEKAQRVAGVFDSVAPRYDL